MATIGGVVAYATELKVELLGVDAVMLRRHGAIYPPVAAAMAQGVRIDNGLVGGEDLIVNPPAELKDGETVKVQ